MDPQHLASLADSIRIQGVLQPILVRPHPEAVGRYQIIAGERRWRASQMAGLHDVPVLVRVMSDEEATAAALVENLQRQDLDAIEEAEGYQRLVTEFGKTQESLAEAIGKSRSHIANTLRLLNLAPTVKTAVRNRTLSAGHARALLGHPEQEKLARDIITRGLNVRQAEALANRKPVPAAIKPVPPSRGDGEAAALERHLSERLGLTVAIHFDGIEGFMKITYKTLDQLDSLVEILSRT
jgi:ParB family chromosome partitioning protein